MSDTVPPTLLTPRLELRAFRPDDLDALAAIYADPEVMRYISGRPERLEETIAIVQRVKQRWIDFGYSWWSFIDQSSGELVGAGCLQNLRREASPAPDPACPLEIGWRLRRDCWGQGLATEAAHRIASFAFETWYGKNLATYEITSDEWHARAGEAKSDSR